MGRWTDSPQPDDRSARSRRDEDGSIHLLWGGDKGNLRGDGHGHLISRDVVNAHYLREPGGKVVVDERRAWADALLHESRMLKKGASRQPDTQRLRQDWRTHVEAGGRPGRDLAQALVAMRKEFNRNVREAERRDRNKPDRRRER